MLISATLSRKPSDTVVPCLYQLNGQVLTHKDNISYLGININTKLQWSNHCQAKATKANQALGFLRRHLKYCPRKLKELSYVSLVRSKMEYASGIWDPHLLDDIKRLEMVQRRAARFVLRDYGWRSSVNDMLMELK